MQLVNIYTTDVGQVKITSHSDIAELFGIPDYMSDRKAYMIKKKQVGRIDTALNELALVLW